MEHDFNRRGVYRLGVPRESYVILQDEIKCNFGLEALCFPDSICYTSFNNKSYKIDLHYDNGKLGAISLENDLYMKIILRKPNLISDCQ